MSNSICGDQQAVRRKDKGSLIITKREKEIFTNKTEEKIWGNNFRTNRKIIANKVFERGYQQYLKKLNK